MHLSSSLVAFICLALALPLSSARSAPRTLKLATWNMEWLIAPSVFRSMRDHCVPKDIPIGGNDRRLPCDVALRFDRSSADFRSLAQYAKQLDADVIALQEVDGPQAAAVVFEGYKFCFTGRRHLQNNGFAIRAGLPYRCEPDLQALSLGDRVRRGAAVTIFPGEPREIRLLSVHLKSGCNRALLDSGRKPCRELARQVPLLEGWIDAQARASKRFAVLGDFNRDLLKDAGAARSKRGNLLRLWAEIDDGDPPEADLTDAAQGQPFVRCAPGQKYSTYIDHIVLSRSLSKALIPDSFSRVTYRPVDAGHLKLSDHCPVSVRVQP
jgi:endonuclease/exonuclease/phosphatase family metal-dependent hydrolase